MKKNNSIELMAFPELKNQAKNGSPDPADPQHADSHPCMPTVSCPENHRKTQEIITIMAICGQKNIIILFENKFNSFLYLFGCRLVQKNPDCIILNNEILICHDFLIWGEIINGFY